MNISNKFDKNPYSHRHECPLLKLTKSENLEILKNWEKISKILKILLNSKKGGKHLEI